MTTNGQAPFITIYMYLNEAKNQQEKEDLAWLIEEVLKQRMQGVKNEEGYYIAPAFPKLIYVLEEDNIREDSEYWYLTELAAECSSRRLVPDYISEKVMLELKGDVYTCMGCVEGSETVTYYYNGKNYIEPIESMWEQFSEIFECQYQDDEINRYIDLEDVKILDQVNGYVDCKRLIRNLSDDWMSFRFNNGLSLTCTSDHPFETLNRGRVLANEIQESDKILTILGEARPCEIVTIAEKSGYSYDVTTSSDHFTVSGIWSCNCRSFLTPDRFTEAGVGNIAKAKNYEPGKHKYYGRLTL